jgi:hypothetical protein
MLFGIADMELVFEDCTMNPLLNETALLLESCGFAETIHLICSRQFTRHRIIQGPTVSRHSVAIATPLPT